MNLILVIVFILAFILANWLIAFIASKHFIAANMFNTYTVIRGNKKREKNRGEKLFAKFDKNLYLKKILPAWFALFLLLSFITKSILLALVLSIVLCCGVYIYIKLTKQIKRKEIFVYQFREALISMSNSLKAGITLPAAIKRCKEDLTNTLRNKEEKPMLLELEIMVNEINMGNNLSDILLKFQERKQIEEVDNFVNAAIISQRTGGNLSEVMVNVCGMIGDRIEIKREIESLTAAKRGESKILTIAPLIILPAMIIISPSYLKPMYETLSGKCLMALAFVLIISNYILGKKIMDIKL